MQNLLYVGIGGAIGAMARYGISIWLQGSFPWGTWVANLLGCFLLGLLIACSQNWSDNWKLLSMVGFCGAFTTFSTFSKESLDFLQNGKWEYFLIYTLGSLALGILSVLAGNRAGNLF